MIETKSIIKFIIALLFPTLMFAVISIFIYVHIDKTIPTLKPNQVWRHITNDDNPFEKPIIFDSKVINVKNGYVQYIRVNRNLDLDTLSSKENIFRFDSKCIDNCK